MDSLVLWAGRLGRGVVLTVRAVGPAVRRLIVAALVFAGLSRAVVEVPVTTDPFEVLPLGPWDTSWVAPLADQLHMASLALIWACVALMGVALVFATGLPDQVEAWIGRRRVRRDFVQVCRAVGLSEEVPSGESTRWHDPRLSRVTSDGGVVVARIRCRRGQSSADVVAAAGKIAADFDPAAFRARTVSPSVAEVRLTMHDGLAGATTAQMPQEVPTGAALTPVHVGRVESGVAWGLRLVGRHTLVAGCSGSGKGSVLWGAVGSLAPWIAQDTVRVHGMGLLHG